MSFPSIAASQTAQDTLSEGLAHHHAGRFPEAERVYLSVLALDAKNAEVLHLLGLLAQQAGDLECAAVRMRAAIALEPDRATYRSNLGNVLQMQRRLDEAVEEYECADRLRPEHGPTLSNLGMALQSLGRLEEAEACLRRAALLTPNSAQVQDNLGNLLQVLGRMDEAVDCHHQALRLNPANAETLGNLALAQQGSGRWRAAMESFDRALAIQQKEGALNGRIALGRAQLQLLLGDFEDGFRNYEIRKQAHGVRRLCGREWQGKSHSNGVGRDSENSLLYLYAEQGLGDTIQFLRYLAQARSAFGGDVVLEVQEPLLALARELPDIRKVLRAGDAPPECEAHCSLMSLPLALRESGMDWRTLMQSSDAGWAVPYLGVPGAARRKANATVQAGNGLQVGLVWAGNPAHVRDRLRSLPFPLLGALLGVGAAQFYSLQIGPGATTDPRLIDMRHAIDDMADTAALIERLDLVIGVDTAVVHLAGALGRPVWTLLPYSPDWRWGLERADCRWYPTMRLFRQSRPGDWAGVLEGVRIALEPEIQKKVSGG